MIDSMSGMQYRNALFLPCMNKYDIKRSAKKFVLFLFLYCISFVFASFWIDWFIRMSVRNKPNVQSAYFIEDREIFCSSESERIYILKRTVAWDGFLA
jgi:hypothetical protein